MRKGRPDPTDTRVTNELPRTGERERGREREREREREFSESV